MDFLSYLDNPYPLIKNVVDYVNSESEFFAIAKQSNLEHSLQYCLSDLIKRTLIKTLNLDPSSQSYNIAINFLMYGTAGIVYDNLNSKNLETAIQIACAIISVLVKSIMPDV